MIENLSFDELREKCEDGDLLGDLVAAEVNERLEKAKKLYPEIFEKSQDKNEEKLPPEEVERAIVWTRLVDTYRRLKASKPNDRSEKDRRMAVAITKYEDMLAWYHTMVLNDFEG